MEHDILGSVTGHTSCATSAWKPSGVHRRLETTALVILLTRITAMHALMSHLRVTSHQGDQLALNHPRLPTMAVATTQENGK